MRRANIGGALDIKALEALHGRTQHRPQSREEMRAAIHEMRSRGMTDYGIAAATRLSVEIVRQMLGEARS